MYSYLRVVFISFVVLCLYPHNSVAQWQQATTLTGGSIVTDIIQFNGNLYAAFMSSGVYKSSDNGKTWTKTSVAPQPNQASFIQHKGQLIVVNYGVSFRTTDGITWNEGAGPEGFINGLASDGTNLFAATPFGMLLSTDDGQTWAKMIDAQLQGDISAVAISGSTVVAVAHEEQKVIVLKSENNGSDWTKLTTNSTSAFTSADQIFLKGGFIYINVPGTGLHRSTDGETWQLLRSDVSYGHFFVSPTAIYQLANFRLSSSTNDGISWSDRQGNMPAFSVSELYVTDQYAFAGTWGGGIFGIQISNSDGWQNMNTGISVQDIDRVVAVNDTILAGTEFSFVRSSYDEGLHWNQETDAYGTINGNVRCMIKAGKDLYIGQGGGGIQRSSDNGKTWKLKNQGLKSLIIEAMAATEKSVYAGTTEGLYKSTDKGESWVTVAEGSIGWVRSLYSDGTSIFAGTWSGLYVSHDEGKEWKKISNDLPDQSIGFMATMGNMLFAATQYNGLYVTTDEGAKWEFVSSEYVQSISAYHDVLFISTLYKRFFVSYDKGKSWKDITRDSPASIVTSTAFTSTHMIIGEGEGSGLWFRKREQVLPPYFTAYTNRPDLKFFSGESIYLKSDQELKTIDDKILTNSNLSDYLIVKNSSGMVVSYTATISDDKKLIAITITNSSAGEKYSVTIDPLKNTAELSSSVFVSDLFSVIENHPPVISSVSVQTDQDKSVAFSESLFISGFSDSDNDPLVKIKVSSLPKHGLLKLNNGEVNMNTELSKAVLSQFVYIPASGFSGSDQWSWSGFDGMVYSSADATVNISVLPVTAIEDRNSSGIKFYPNPVSSRLYFDLPEPMNSILKVSIIDMRGIEMKNVHLTQSAQATDIDLTQLPSGVYLIRINYEGETIVRKIIKQ